MTMLSDEYNAVQRSYPGTRPPAHALEVRKAKSPFSQVEYQQRIAAIKRESDHLSVDALLIVNSANICYLCGYLGESGYVPQGLIINSSDFPSLYLRRQDAAAGRHYAFMPNDHIIGYSESLIGHPRYSGFDSITDEISRLHIKRLGVEYDSISAKTLARLKHQLPNVILEDISGIVERVRVVKSPSEISVQREAAQITNYVMSQVPEYFENSRSETEVAAKITSALILGVDDIAGHKTDPLVMPGAELSGTSHITWRDVELRRGHHYNPEFGAARYGYCVGLMRTVSLGPPSDRLQSLSSAISDGCDAALQAFKPGNTCADVARAYVDILHRAGYWKDSRCGYPIGINWLEGSCSLRVDDYTEIVPGMVFHLMLGTWLDEDFGAVTSETVLVTNDGCELLTNAPPGLMIV